MSDDDTGGGLDDATAAALLRQLGDLAEEVVNLRKENRLLAQTIERVDATAARSAQGLDEFETALNELGAQMATAATSAPESAPAEPPAQPAAAVEVEELDMNVLAEWVQQHIGNWAQRKLARTLGSATGFPWCTQWWEHPEAVTLLWLLRQSWIDAVQQGGPALLVYFRDCYYPALRLITDPQGPFHACIPGEHKDSEFVPVHPIHGSFPTW
ncbi:DUF4913 domain-containing protein [Nocardia thailandica]